MFFFKKNLVRFSTFQKLYWFILQKKKKNYYFENNQGNYKTKFSVIILINKVKNYNNSIRYNCITPFFYKYLIFRLKIPSECNDNLVDTNNVYTGFFPYHFLDKGRHLKFGIKQSNPIFHKTTSKIIVPDPCHFSKKTLGV